jgi:hypothetical protein
MSAVDGSRWQLVWILARDFTATAIAQVTSIPSTGMARFPTATTPPGPTEFVTSAVAAKRDPDKQQPSVTFQFKGDAMTRFADYMAMNVNNHLTITLDNKVIESALIQSQITGPGRSAAP